MEGQDLEEGWKKMGRRSWRVRRDVGRMTRIGRRHLVEKNDQRGVGGAITRAAIMMMVNEIGGEDGEDVS